MKLLISTLVVAVCFMFAGVFNAKASSVVVKRKQIICKVFGPKYCRQAINVASCETGGTFDVWARNGQYLGLFQMGSSERDRYGHGRGAWDQARAAKRYFVASGRDWSPWSCRWAAY